MEKRFFYRGIREKGGKLIGAFLLPVLLCLAVCALFHQYPFGNDTLLIWDMNWQYASFFSHLHDILHGNASAFYSFSRAIGGDMFGVEAYYLLSPYNLIFYFFGKETIYAGIFILVLAKIGSMGLTMQWYLGRKNPGFETLLFSTAYAVSGFTVAYFHNIMWFDGMILLPLMIAGIERLFEEGNYLLYLLSLAAALVTNFYIGYMLCIFSVLYAVCFFVFFQERGTGIKERIRGIVLYTVSSLAAGALAAFALIPTYQILQEGKASVWNRTLLSDWKRISSFGTIFKSSFMGTIPDDVILSDSPMIYCGVFSLFLVCVLFLRRDISVKRKAGSFLLLAVFYLSMTRRNLYLLWHGMSEPMGSPFRFAFLCVFLMILLAEQAYRGWKPNKVSPFLVGAALLLFCIVGRNVFLQQGHQGNLIWNVALVVVYAVLLAFFKNHKIRTGILFGIAGTELVLNAGYLYTYSSFYASESVEDYENYITQTAPLVQQAKEEDGWFRMVLSDAAYRTVNDNFLWNTYGLESYTSVEQKPVHLIANSLGYEQSMGLGIHYGSGSTLAAESFLGVKYKISTEEDEPYEPILSGETAVLYKNKCALPLAMFVREEMQDLELQEGNSMKYQNDLYRNLQTNVYRDVFTPVIKSGYELLNCTEKEDGTYEVTDGGQQAYIIYHFPLQMQGNYYIQYRKLYGKEVQIVIDGVEYPLQNVGSCIQRLGDMEGKEELLLWYPVDDGETGQLLNNFYLYCENRDTLELYAGEVNNQNVSVVYDTDSHFLVNCANTTEKSQLLMLTMPYDSGWEVFVDGTKTENVLEKENFMFVEVEPGEHEIAFWYYPKRFWVGVTISVATAVALVILCGLTTVWNKKRNQREKKA